MRKFLCLLLILSFPPLALAQVAMERSADLPDRYLVKFDAGENVAARMRSEKSAAIKTLRLQQAANIERLENDLQGTDLVVLRNLWLRQSVAVSLSVKYLPSLRNLNYVIEVRSDKQYRAKTLGVVTLPLSGEFVQDNLDRVAIDSLWNEQYRGQGVVVAIVDSGVDALHADLVDRWRGGSNSWFDAHQQHVEPKDVTGHGTAVASIVLGGNAAFSYSGVAPHAQWIAARIFDNSGNSSESAISAALQWLIDPDGDPGTDDYPDIVQNSWGLATTEGSCINPFAVELAAIDALGIDQVFAVGNSGLSGPGAGGFSSYLTPSFDSHVISVGAIDATDDLLFSSSRGPDRCGSAIIPALVAPGDFIRTADLSFDGFDPDNTTLNTGTSFSSPHVSGVLALLRSKYQAANYLQYRTAIFDSAVGLGAQNDYGRGVVQAAAADTLLQNQAVTPRPAEVGFGEAVYVFGEKTTTARVWVVRAGDISTAASVDIHSVDATATSADDFQEVLATLDFGAGQATRIVDLIFVDDAIDEGTETFSLVLSNNVNINLGARTSLIVALQDDNGTAFGADEEDEVGGSSIGILGLFIFAILWIGRRIKP